ncbi:unnamed protein product [Absidia cylindrospora]
MNGRDDGSTKYFTIFGCQQRYDTNYIHLLQQPLFYRYRLTTLATPDAVYGDGLSASNHFISLTTLPSNKSFITKVKLGKAQKQNRPLPHWFRLKSDTKSAGTPSAETGATPN